MATNRTEAQKRADAKYRTKTKRLTVDFSHSTDQDIITRLETIDEPKAIYIKRLIREDLARND